MLWLCWNFPKAQKFCRLLAGTSLVGPDSEPGPRRNKLARTLGTRASSSQRRARRRRGGRPAASGRPRARGRPAGIEGLYQPVWAAERVCTMV